MRLLAIEATGEGPPWGKERPVLQLTGRLTRIRSSIRTIRTLKRRATVKAPPIGIAFVEALPQALGECFAGSTGTQALLDIYVARHDRC
jgi:hypothetical protein